MEPLPPPPENLPPPPLRKWEVALRHGIAWTLFGVSVLVLLGMALLPQVSDGELPVTLIEPWRWGLDMVAGVAAGVIIRWRRTHPLRVGLALAVLSGLSFTAAPFWAWSLMSVASRRHLQETAVVGGAAVLTQSFAIFVPGINIDPQPSMWLELFWWTVGLGFSVAYTLVYIAVGYYLGARRQLVAGLQWQAETAHRQRTLVADQARAAERVRLAREMHDVLAHRISLISMHAGVLAYRDDLPAEKSREVAGIIQDNAHNALTELRSVLATLRSDELPQGPQPGANDLAALVESEREAGMHLTASIEIRDIETVPSGLGRHLYRTVQEVCTNARKHAMGAPVTLLIQGGPVDGISLEARNPTTVESGVPGAGVGLIGLAERAHLVGGAFGTAVESGDFVVRAWFPWQTQNSRRP